MSYIKYLEARLALAENALRQDAISMPRLQLLEKLPVKSVITWTRTYPRGDTYMFVAFLQKTNEWHLVSGKSKVIKTHLELSTEYLFKANDDLQVLT